MKESKNMLNSIFFYAEKEYKINDYWQRQLFRVNVSTLMQLGYDIEKYGYRENDIVYLDEESYKNFMAPFKPNLVLSDTISISN